jgi:hypothetical protein
MAGVDMIFIALLLGIGMAALSSLAIGNDRIKWALGGLAGVAVVTFLCSPVVTSPFLFFQALALLVVIGTG